jgi:hypothetical protein
MPKPPERTPPARACPNCGTWVDDHFCPRCGQRNVERLVSVRRMARDVAEDQLTLGAALPRTLVALLLRPGFLTREYAAGRIARYVAPFRLYLLASLLFFVSVSWIADANAFLRRAEPGLREWQRKHPGERPRIVDLQADTTRTPTLLRPVARLVLRQQDRVNAMEPREAMRALISSLFANAPRVAFLLVPLLAALLKLLYVRGHRLYAEHFVFALHVQSFAFLAGVAAVLVVGLGVGRFLLLWTLVYLLWAMKRAYGQGWPKTIAKCAVLVVVYAGLLGATISALSILTMFAV